MGERFIAETEIDENQVMLVQITPESRLSYFPVAAKNSLEFAASCAMVVLENVSPSAQVSLPLGLIARQPTPQPPAATPTTTPIKKPTKSNQKIDVKQLIQHKRRLVWALGLQTFALLFWATQIGQEVSIDYLVVSLTATLFALWSVYKVASLLNYQPQITFVMMLLTFMSNALALMILLFFNYQSQKALAQQGKQVGFFEFL